MKVLTCLLFIVILCQQLLKYNVEACSTMTTTKQPPKQSNTGKPKLPPLPKGTGVPSSRGTVCSFNRTKNLINFSD